MTTSKTTKIPDQSTMVDDLLTKLRAALMRHNNGDYEWPLIPNSEMDEMFDLLKCAITLKWGKDYEGDLPVSMQLLDLKKFYTPFDCALIHGHQGEKNEAREVRQMENIGICNAAIHAFSETSRRILADLSDIKLNKICQTNAIEVWVVFMEKNNDQIVKNPAIIFESESLALQYKTDRLEALRIENRWATPSKRHCSLKDLEAFKAQVKLTYGKIFDQYVLIQDLNLIKSPA